MNYVRMFAFLTLALTFFVRSAGAQAQAKDSQPQTYQTLYLASPAQQNDAVEIVTDLRNMLPRAKVYYVPSQSAISMIGTSDDFLLAKKILSDIDRSRKIYRLTYTITETDSGQSLERIAWPSLSPRENRLTSNKALRCRLSLGLTTPEPQPQAARCNISM